MKYTCHKGAGKRIFYLHRVFTAQRRNLKKIIFKTKCGKKAGVAVKFELGSQNKTVLANKFSVKGRDKSTRQLSKIIRKNLLLAIHSAMHGE